MLKMFQLFYSPLKLSQRPSKLDSYGYESVRLTCSGGDSVHGDTTDIWVVVPL